MQTKIWDVRSKIHNDKIRNILGITRSLLDLNGMLGDSSKAFPLKNFPVEAASGFVLPACDMYRRFNRGRKQERPVNIDISPDWMNLTLVSIGTLTPHENSLVILKPLTGQRVRIDLDVYKKAGFIQLEVERNSAGDCFLKGIVDSGEGRHHAIYIPLGEWDWNNVKFVWKSQPQPNEVKLPLEYMALTSTYNTTTFFQYLLKNNEFYMIYCSGSAGRAPRRTVFIKASKVYEYTCQALVGQGPLTLTQAFFHIEGGQGTASRPKTVFNASFRRPGDAEDTAAAMQITFFQELEELLG